MKNAVSGNGRLIGKPVMIAVLLRHALFELSRHWGTFQAISEKTPLYSGAGVKLGDGTLAAAVTAADG